MKIYIAKLIEEIEKCNVKDKRLKSLYFWWGTATSYTPEELGIIMDKIKEKFTIDEHFEFNLETTPFNVTAENLEKWHNLWVNRLSMWVQSLNDKTLEEITRDNSKVIFEAMDLIENSKINNLNIDFILWLPHVKPGETAKNIEYLLNSYKTVKWISVYMLEDYNYPESWKNISIEEKEYSLEYEKCVETLKKYSIYRYELSNFAKKWFESQHNIWYWSHDEYIGFWIDASSFVWGKRWGNWNWFDKYYKWELEYSETLTKEDIEFEKRIFDLRRGNLLIWGDLDKKWLKKMVNEWLIIVTWNKIEVTAFWIPLLDYIITEI